MKRNIKGVEQKETIIVEGVFTPTFLSSVILADPIPILQKMVGVNMYVKTPPNIRHPYVKTDNKNPIYKPPQYPVRNINYSLLNSSILIKL